MKTKNCFLNKTIRKHCSLLIAFCTLIIFSADAAVVSRNQRPSTSARMPTMTARIQDDAAAEFEPEIESVTIESDTVVSYEPEPEPEPESIIEDKTSQFDEFMAENASSATDASRSSLADKIRSQRAALDAADAASAASSQMAAARASGQNACDQNLRACMKQKCGNDYSKCAGDTDTMWGTKMDACRRDLPCTGSEYAMFATEIKADRDMNARIASYNAIVDCGNRYNDCIITECGQKFTKCLGKKAGDTAISKCAKIAKSCTEQDSGLASRTMNVFGTLRVDAEKQVASDEKRLYELRDLMRDTCGRLGAMFDERTLDCVYTVNFYAGEDNTLYASKKAYAGSTFDCNQNWFGVDITTFKENAFRLTREQTSATSALMGSGIGMATGAITSGAIDRAIDRHKAERAVKKAEKEHEEMYGDGDDKKKDKKDKGKDDSNEDDDDNKPGAAEKRCTKANGTWANGTCTGAQCGDNKEWSDEKNKCVKIKEDKGNAKGTDKEGEKKSDGDNSVPERPDDKTAQKNCKKAKGDWADGICKNPKCGDDARWDDWTQTCKKYAAGEKPATYTDPETACRIQGGTWTGKTCLCKGFENKWNGVTYKCEPNSTSSGTSGLGGKGFGTSKLGTGNTFNKALSGTSTGSLAPTSGLKGNNAVTADKTGTNNTPSTPPASQDKTKK